MRKWAQAFVDKKISDAMKNPETVSQVIEANAAADTIDTLANGALDDVDTSAVEKTKEDLKKAETELAAAKEAHSAARNYYADEMHKCAESFTAMSDEEHDVLLQTLVNAKNAYQSAIKIFGSLSGKLKLDQGVLNRLLSGIIAKARADAKVNAQAAILSEVAAQRMDANMQKADEIANATVRIEQPLPENVSIEGGEGNPLAQTDGNSIIKDGTQVELGNAAGPDGDGQTAVGTGLTLTLGIKIPEEILENKPSYSPNISKWLEGGGKITVENETWIYTNQLGISVTYRNGYPDFKGSGHVKQEVDIGSFNGRIADFRLADQLAPNGPRSPLSIWHHHEDGRTLQEVNRRTHEMFTHKGGVSIMKRSEK